MSSPIKQSSVGSAGVWIVCCMSELVLCVVVVSWIGMCAVVRLRGSCVLLWRGLVSAVVVWGWGMFVVWMDYVSLKSTHQSTQRCDIPHDVTFNINTNPTQPVLVLT